jgi:hypothetical protein
MSGDEQKSFNLTNEYLHTASAIQNAAYSLASTDGQSFEIIRSTGAGLWQHETFDVPWEAIDSQLTAPPQGQPVLLVTHFNDSGTRLTAFAPADGRYAIFEANSPVDSIENTASWCPGDGIGTPGDATFRSLAWDEVLQTYYAGDKSGNVYALDPAVGCMDITNRIQIAMPESLPVTQISVLAPGRLGVMQDDTAVAGSLRIVNYDGSAFNIESLVLENICDVPLGSMLLAGEYIAVMCAQESDLEIPVDTTPNPQDAWIDPRSYIIYNINSGVLINQATIDKENSSGVAIDSDTAMAYRMIEGGFGHLEVTNLLTGETRKTLGLYIRDILN